MKEFIDKLIKRLEELKQTQVQELCEHKNHISEMQSMRGFNVLQEATKIVNQLAEEYNGGWIPCSERLPETNESVFCWAKSTARGGDVCFVGSCHNGFWFLQSSADTHSFPGQYVIVAWQPLPDPYIEK